MVSQLRVSVLIGLACPLVGVYLFLRRLVFLGVALPQIQGTFEKAYRAGVKIAFGTDTGVSAHGENAQEFGYMVNGGMPASEALQSATIVAAQLLKVDSQLGSITPGKRADIIAVDGNPLENIDLMNHVSFVMKDGKVYKR